MIVGISPVVDTVDDDYRRALGPLLPLLDDDRLTEVMVNGPDTVYVEVDGRLVLTDVAFDDEAHLVRVISAIVGAVGRRIDAREPLCDARLLDGSRVTASLPPVAVHGPMLTIRKFRRHPLDVPELVEMGTMSADAAACLHAFVRARANILVTGGTGSGKTTLLNALASFIDIGDRVITIEDSAELRLQQPHVCALEMRLAEPGGHDEVSIRDLVRHALRMRPDRIVVGECRGGEAMDMLQAMNTAHNGSMTTLHANSPRDALARLETLAMMAGLDLPARAVRAQIASALDIIVQIARFRDGTRRISSITEVCNIEGEVITLQDLFRLEQRGVDADGRLDASLVPTGLRPHHAARLAEGGLQLPIPGR